MKWQLGLPLSLILVFVVAVISKYFGFNLAWLLILISALWAAFDSNKIGLRNYKSGLSYGPVILFFALAGVWIVGFPWYLHVRYKIKNNLAELKLSDSPSNEDGDHLPERNEVKWSLALLRTLELKRFEMLCAEYFRTLEERVETATRVTDGGIDVRIFAKNSNQLEYVVQCKASSNIIGIEPVRELFGLSIHEGASKGVLMTTSTFSNEAKLFAAKHGEGLFLVDVHKFLDMLLDLPKEKQQKLLPIATEALVASASVV